MERTVIATLFYADIFFLYNLAADYAVLKTTALLWNKRGRIFLYCLLINIVCTVLVCIFGLYVLMQYLALLAAVAVCLSPKSIGELMGMTATAYAAAFVTGSLSLGLMSLTAANEFIMLIPAALIVMAAKKAENCRSLSAFSGLYPLYIELDGTKTLLTALADSGNGLRIKGKYAVIADEGAVKPLLPHITDTYFTDCTSVTGKKRLLCFNADISIDGNTYKNICIAVSAEKLGGNFDALFNPKMLEKV